MNTLHLIRHGRTVGTERKLFYGGVNIPLSESGVEEIKRIRNTMHYPDINGLRVITSGMIRAEQTFELIYGDVPHTADPRFREMSYGDFEMHSYEELCERPDFIKWSDSDFMTTRTPNGDCGNDIKNRVLSTLDELFDGDDTLILCHGGVILVLMGYWFPGERKAPFDWQPDPGTGFTIHFEGRKAVSYEKIPV